MKIEWLNQEKTRALITKGWFRKRQAEVHQTIGGWCFTANGADLDMFVGFALDKAQRKALINP